MAGLVVGEIVYPCRPTEGRDDAAGDIADVDAAEDLVGRCDAMRATFGDAIENRAAGAIDAGKTKNANVAA